MGKPLARIYSVRSRSSFSVEQTNPSRLPVSIDGRSNLAGDERLNRSIATWSGEPDWASDPDLKAAALVIAPIEAPLTQLLRTDSRFELAYEDRIASVFTRRAQTLR